MKFYVPTSAHWPRLKCIPLIKKLGLNTEFVCASEEEAKRFRSDPRSEGFVIHVADMPDHIDLDRPRHERQDTVSYLRTHISTKLAEPHVWFGMLDDNIYDLTALIEPYYEQNKLDFEEECPEGEWRDQFDHSVTPWKFRKIVEESLNTAERNLTRYVGFAIETNYYFRKNKWQWWGYCRSGCSFYKSNGPDDIWHYPPDEFCMWEDFAKSVEIIARCGIVVINRFMKPQQRAFEEGGIGTFEQRKPNLIESCRNIKRRYPGLVTESKGRPWVLTLAKRSQRTIDEWRRQHGYLS